MVMVRGESCVLAKYSAWRAGAGHVTALLAARARLVALGPAVRAPGALQGRVCWQCCAWPEQWSLVGADIFIRPPLYNGGW